MKKLFVSLCLVFCMAITSHAAVIDQQNIADLNDYLSLTSPYTYQQGVTSGTTGRVTGIELYLNNRYGAPAQDVLVSIISSGTILAEDTQYWDGTTRSILFDFSADTVFFNAGSNWIFQVKGTDPTPQSFALECSRNVYSGDLTIIAPTYTYTSILDDIRFTEYVEASASPVPEPCTILLLGSGLLGIAGFRKKIH